MIVLSGRNTHLAAVDEQGLPRLNLSLERESILQFLI